MKPPNTGSCRSFQIHRILPARGGIRFGVGPLTYLLRNRFFIGEVVYRGAVHSGEQEPIVDQALFEAVQVKLASTAADRQLRIKCSPAILAGRIFDDRGNRMTPTHSNKQGARYRYYVSHALMQRRNNEAGNVPRVPAHEIEALVINAIRAQSGNGSNSASQHLVGDRDLIEQKIERIIIKPQAVEIHLARETGHRSEDQAADADNAAPGDDRPAPILSVPWSGSASTALKGILHSASVKATMTPERRDVLLSAIAKARAWVDDLVAGRCASFAEIAERESKVEAHVRFLAPLAFVSPAVISAIVAGSAPPSLKITALVKGVAYLWTDQERRLGIPHARSS